MEAYLHSCSTTALNGSRVMSLTVIMLTYFDSLLSKTLWFRNCIHLRNLNINHFKEVEAMELNGIAPVYPSMMSSPYKMLSKSTHRFQSDWRSLAHARARARTHTHTHTHTHTDRLMIYKPHFHIWKAG
jgi:hypothetical protein